MYNKHLYLWIDQMIGQIISKILSITKNILLCKYQECFHFSTFVILQYFNVFNN